MLSWIFKTKNVRDYSYLAINKSKKKKLLSLRPKVKLILKKNKITIK